MIDGSLKIRPAVDEDSAAMCGIYNEAVLYSTASYDIEPEAVCTRAEWLSLHRWHRLPVLVAEVDGIVVGWSSLSLFHGRAGYRYTVEDSIHITESWRGQGLGKLLLAPLVDSARTLGMHAIIASIDADSESSLRLHASLGFVEVGRLKQVGWKFNFWRDVIFMERLLGT
ncbi:MAG: N-acetyltransferase family protein [Capsulimonadaceae bacterium]